MDLTLLVAPGSSSPSPEALRETGILAETGGRPGAEPRDASGTYVLVVERGARLDLDLFTRMWKKKEEAEVVIASRHVRGGNSGAGLIGPLLSSQTNRALRLLLRLPYLDLTSPIRLYKTSTLRRLPFSIAATGLESLVELHNRGYKIREVAFADGSSKNPAAALAQAFRSLLSSLRLASSRRSPEAADADDLASTSRLPWRRKALEQRQQSIVGCLEVDVPVLDVGCGSSRLIQALAKGAGVDHDLGKLRFLRGRARATVAGALPRLPFRDQSFPQVVCCDVIGFLPQESPFLAELHRVLQPRGTLVLATPGKRRSRRFTEAALRGELEDSGFAIDEVRKTRGRELVVRAIRRER
jgi:SAM-dependent methyltransferase